MIGDSRPLDGADEFNIKNAIKLKPEKESLEYVAQELAKLDSPGKVREAAKQLGYEDKLGPHLLDSIEKTIEKNKRRK